MSEAAHPIPEAGFDQLVGLEDVAMVEGVVSARVRVRPELLQPFGLVHGGVYAAIAESLASMGTYVQVAPEGKMAMGMSNSTAFLRPITKGTIHASARTLHRGRTTWLWDVEIRDDDERLCATTRMTIAVREPRVR